jgi:hypothetical protein
MEMVRPLVVIEADLFVKYFVFHRDSRFGGVKMPVGLVENQSGRLFADSDVCSLPACYYLSRSCRG